MKEFLTTGPYAGPVTIKEEFELIHKHNPASGHHWTEAGKTTGFRVEGGGWAPTHHRTLRAAEKEAETRNRTLSERLN